MVFNYSISAICSSDCRACACRDPPRGSVLAAPPSNDSRVNDAMKASGTSRTGISASIACQYIFDHRRDGIGFRRDDGAVEPAEVGEHRPPSRAGPAECPGIAGLKRELRLEQRVLGPELEGNRLALRKRELDGARGRPGEARASVDVRSPRRCGGRQHRSTHRPGVHDPMAVERGTRSVEGDRVRRATRPRRSNAPRVGGGGWRIGARPGAPRNRRGRGRRRVRCTLARPGESANRSHLELLTGRRTNRPAARRAHRVRAASTPQSRATARRLAPDTQRAETRSMFSFTKPRCALYSMLLPPSAVVRYRSINSPMSRVWGAGLPRVPRRARAV